MPYLFNRANVLGLEYNPFKMMKEKATLNNGIHIDLYSVFSNRSLKIYAFGAKYITDKLDDVSEAMLGEKKVEYTGSIADISLNLLSKYCYNDSRLTYELSHYNNDLVMNLLVILCRVGNMPIDDISRLSISNWIKSMFYNEHRINNQLIPRSVDFPRIKGTTTAGVKGKKYQGAEVLEPVSGIHFDVTVLDFASLYPSIIKTRNISYETVCCCHEECKSNIIPYTQHWSCTKKIGMASLLIGSLKELRVNHFKVLSKTSQTQKERDINNTIAQALKVFLNASYGVIGAETFSLYFLPTAEAVTAVGRDIISKTIETAKP
jgi:DNA polymerase, archaea type